MAAPKHTTADGRDNSLVIEATMQRLQTLVETARGYRDRRTANLPAGVQSRAFIAWSESTAEARGFLGCLVTLHLLCEDDEAAWFEYLSGARDTVPWGNSP